MREIKFRLVKDGKIVGYETHTIDPDINEGICIYHKCPADEVFKYGYPITSGDKWFIFHDSKEQFTGLLDRNDKEIYEGDIVQTKYETMPPISIMWRDGGFYYSPPKKDPNDGRLFCVCEFTTESDEVIGNIHDNPELLSK